MHRLSIALLGLIGALASGEVRVRPLVIAGDPVPGLPGVSIGSIESMQQDSLGRVVFTAWLEGDVTPESDRALVRFGDRLEVLVREGDPVPGQNATIQSIYDSEVVPGDHVVFTAYLNRGRTGGGWGSFLCAENGLILFADDLMEVPGRPSNERFLRWPSVTAFADGRVLVSGEAGSPNPPSMRGVWVGPPGALTLITPPGVQIPGMDPGIVFSASFLSEIGPDSALIGGYISGPDVSQSNDRCIWEYSATGLRVVARELDVLPGMSPSQYLADVGGPGDMHPANGRFVIRGNLPGGQYRYGFWAEHGDTLRCVVMVDNPTPDGSTFRIPAEALTSTGGEVLFSSSITTADGTGLSSIWLSRPSGELIPLARQDQVASGLPRGYRLVQLGIAGSVQDLHAQRISASGRIAYWGLASGPGPLIEGLWSGDPDRAIELALATGTRFGPEMEYEVDEIRQYSLNDRDQLAAIVRTTELRTALVQILLACEDPACGAADVAGADCRVDIADLGACWVNWAHAAASFRRTSAAMDALESTILR